MEQIMVRRDDGKIVPVRIDPARQAEFWNNASPGVRKRTLRGIGWAWTMVRAHWRSSFSTLANRRGIGLDLKRGLFRLGVA